MSKIFHASVVTIYIDVYRNEWHFSWIFYFAYFLTVNSERVSGEIKLNVSSLNYVPRELSRSPYETQRQIKHFRLSYDGKKSSSQFICKTVREKLFLLDNQTLRLLKWNKNGRNQEMLTSFGSIRKKTPRQILNKKVSIV